MTKGTRDLNNHVTKYCKWPINMEKCSTSSIRKKQINSTMWYCCKTTRKAKITKTDNVGKDKEQGKFPYVVGGSMLVQLLWKPVWYYLLKLMIHITYELAIPLLGTDQTEMHVHRHQETQTRVMTATLSIDPKWTIQGPPTKQWINADKWLCYTHIIVFHTA